MQILILCTGNSARSQMAEGILSSLDTRLDVFSAGTNPALEVNRFAIQCMKEIGINIDTNYPKSVEQFISDSFDYVITVCDNAKENCPHFVGEVKQRLHLGFSDPADTKGTDEEKLSVFRRIRDEIKQDFNQFYNNNILPNL